MLVLRSPQVLRCTAGGREGIGWVPDRRIPPAEAGESVLPPTHPGLSRAPGPAATALRRGWVQGRGADRPVLGVPGRDGGVGGFPGLRARPDRANRQERARKSDRLRPPG